MLVNVRMPYACNVEQSTSRTISTSIKERERCRSELCLFHFKLAVPAEKREACGKRSDVTASLRYPSPSPLRCLTLISYVVLSGTLVQYPLVLFVIAQFCLTCPVCLYQLTMRQEAQSPSVKKLKMYFIFLFYIKRGMLKIIW